jgi:hypothetical protein
MGFIKRVAGILLVVAAATGWTRRVQEEKSAEYVSPSQAIEKCARNEKVQLIRDGDTKEYAVIFSKGDEAFSGLMEFAEKYQIKSGHFTAIGALNSATLAWFDL